MKRLLIATAAVTLAAMTIPAVADDGLIPEKMVPGSFSANVDFVSEYLFRGISQTNDEPAIQGGFDWSLDSKPVGVYAGTWLSNTNFNSAGGTLEWDLYGGVQGEVHTIAWKLGGIWFHYPTEPAGLAYDYGEVALQLGHDFGPFSLTYNLNYSPDYFAESGTGVWNALTASVPVGKVTLSAWGGHQSIEKNANFGTPDYYTYGVSAAAKIVGFDTTLAFQDTSIPRGSCFPGTVNGGGCGPTVTLMVARSF